MAIDDIYIESTCTAPTITQQASDASICANSLASFHISASGGNLTYQWQENTGSGFANLSNSGIYSGAQSTDLMLSSAPLAMNGYQYRCIVMEACGPQDTTQTATLFVTMTAPTITLQPANATVCEGNTANFQVSATGTGLSYQWQEDDGNGFTNLGNGSGYSGTTTANLSVSNLSSSMDGYQYRCIVSGGCSPADTSSIASLSINTAPDVTMQASNVSTCTGNNASFSIQATGSNLTYQWQENQGSGFANLEQWRHLQWCKQQQFNN